MRQINNVRLPHPLGKFKDNRELSLLVDDRDVIISIEAMPPEPSRHGENWGGDWVSPMGLDLQINGGYGIGFSDLTFDQLSILLDLLDRLWLDGVDSICPTLVSCDASQLRTSLSVLEEARKLHHERRCSLLGAHLEGPFIQASKRGAHAIEHVCNPSLSALEERINGFESQIALVTLAPEINGSELVINKLKSLNIVLSLGHTDANANTAKQFFDSGGAMLTHTFNAMRGIHHREPGPITEAIKNGNIALGLIADGVHVNPDVAVFLQILASERLALVSDALSPYGLQDGEFTWDSRSLIVSGFTCRLADGTLAGTTLPLLEGCIRLAKWSREPAAAIWSATVAPRNVLRKGLTLYEHLIGKSIKNLLRWRQNETGGELTWRQAD